MKKSEPRLPGPDQVELDSSIEIAAADGKLVFFIGNGLSRLYGLPSWDQLSLEMLKMLAQRKLITYAQLDLLKAASTKTRISIADRRFRQLRGDPRYPELTYKSALGLETGRPPRDAKAYQILATCKARFITTNYDLFLLEAYQRKLASAEPVAMTQSAEAPAANANAQKTSVGSARLLRGPSEFNRTEFLRNDVIWHLHGSVEDESQIVASTRNYLDVYSNEEIQTQLQWVFENHVVVFVGYGLDELEVLDMIVRATRLRGLKPDPAKLTAHVLLPLYSHEEVIVDQLKEYYLDLGINLIPFSKDERDYFSYEILLEKWAGRLSTIANEPSRMQEIQLLGSLIREVEGDLNG